MNEMGDVAIVGGSLVGSSLAIALGGGGFRVALIEAALAPVSEQPSYDERNLSLARASTNLLEALGAWLHTKNQAAPIEFIQISWRGDFGTVKLDAAYALGKQSIAERPGFALAALRHDSFSRSCWRKSDRISSA